MLASRNLLKGRNNIERAKKDGQLFQSTNFGISILDLKNEEAPAFAFIVSTKISKLAVQRNRISRAISEAVRVNLNIIPNGICMIFLAKRSLANKATDEIMRETEAFLRSHKF